MKKDNYNQQAKLLFIAATHGNESFSVPVLEKLEKNFPKKDYDYDWIIGNLLAYEQNTRFVDADLNRSAPGNANAQSYEELRAAELIKISQKYDMVVDIHGTISPCDIVKIISKPSLENLVLASLFPEMINIIWYSARSLQSGPLVQFMEKPALEIECSMNDSGIEEKLYGVLARALFIKQGMNWMNLTASLSKQKWFQVIAQAKNFDPEAKELQPMNTDKGAAYPFLTNQYKKTPYYLLKKINIEDQFIYQ